MWFVGDLTFWSFKSPRKQGASRRVVSSPLDVSVSTAIRRGRASRSIALNRRSSRGKFFFSILLGARLISTFRKIPRVRMYLVPILLSDIGAPQSAALCLLALLTKLRAEQRESDANSRTRKLNETVISTGHIVSSGNKFVPVDESCGYLAKIFSLIART